MAVPNKRKRYKDHKGIAMHYDKTTRNFMDALCSVELICY